MDPSFFDIFNPSTWGSPDSYGEWWFYVLNTMFHGFVPRLVASVCLTVSVYSFITHGLRLTAVLFIAVVFITYSGNVINWLVGF